MINWKVLALWLIAAALVGWGFRALAGAGAYWVVSMVLGALVLSGALSELETRMTNKPSGKKSRSRR